MCLALSDFLYEDDPSGSFHFAKRACDRLDHGLSCLRTAQMYESGYGPGKIDRGQARFRYDKACRLGVAQACDRR